MAHATVTFSVKRQRASPTHTGHTAELLTDYLDRVHSHSQNLRLWFLPRPQLDSALCYPHIFSIMQDPFRCSFPLSCGEFLQRHLCCMISHSSHRNAIFNLPPSYFLIKAWRATISISLEIQNAAFLQKGANVSIKYSSGIYKFKICLEALEKFGMT